MLLSLRYRVYAPPDTAGNRPRQPPDAMLVPVPKDLSVPLHLHSNFASGGTLLRWMFFRAARSEEGFRPLVDPISEGFDPVGQEVLRTLATEDPFMELIVDVFVSGVNIDVNDTIVFAALAWSDAKAREIADLRRQIAMEAGGSRDPHPLSVCRNREDGAKDVEMVLPHPLDNVPRATDLQSDVDIKLVPNLRRDGMPVKMVTDFVEEASTSSRSCGSWTDPPLTPRTSW